MQIQLRSEDRAKIENSVRDKYSLVAENASRQFNYPTGRKGLEALRYDSGFMEALPESVSRSYCGVGNPLALGPIQKGAVILDIGCEAGVDSIAAARQTGQDDCGR